MKKPKTIYTFSNDFKARLTRFHNYLVESDAEGIKSSGFATSQRDRERIQHVGYIYEKYRPSNLTFTTAELYALQLGSDIISYGEEIFNELKNHPFDWHDIVALGEILQLGWDIQYYNQD